MVRGVSGHHTGHVPLMFMADFGAENKGKKIQTAPLPDKSGALLEFYALLEFGDRYI